MIKGVKFIKGIKKILNICAPNNRDSIYVKQKLIALQAEIDRCTILVGKFDILSQ